MLLGRTRAGCATVSPFLWTLAAPPVARRRFEMFRMALVYHRMLYSDDWLVRGSPS
jgi:hypothetical protein